MRIDVVRSGGLAGLRSERSVDTARLPRADAAGLEEAVARLGFFERSPRRARGVPDAFTYRVRIEAAGRAREVAFEDVPENAGWRELAERVLTGASPNK